MSEHHPKREVRIHINRHPFESPNPTTGEALYRLGGVQAGLALYREAKGDREDSRVPDGPESVHLTEDEHFYSAKPDKKQVIIVVDGSPHEWSLPEISYAQVVTLAVPDYPQHPEINYSVKYKDGPGPKPDGVLSPGGSVKVKDGMCFSVHKTGQS